MHSVIQKDWMKIQEFSPSQVWTFLTWWMNKQDKGTIIARSKQEKSGITRKNKRYRRNWLYLNNPRENPKETADLESENNFTKYLWKDFGFGGVGEGWIGFGVKKMGEEKRRMFQAKNIKRLEIYGSKENLFAKRLNLKKLWFYTCKSCIWVVSHSHYL